MTIFHKENIRQELGLIICVCAKRLSKLCTLSPIIAMIMIITCSNYFVQFPINDWLTWGAFPYPLSLVVTECVNRLYGSKLARKIVYIGFLWGLILSFWLATPRIAIASGTAYLVSQLLDIYVFNHLRQKKWWVAPLFASFFASIVDSVIFWHIAFWGQTPLITWLIGDFCIKILIDIVMLTPFRIYTNRQLVRTS